MSKKAIQIVDLFAGPGGLGEGFSSCEDNFQIVVSAEMDPNAHKTLRLRAFFRLLKRQFPEGLSDYYAYCNGISRKEYSERTKDLWERSGDEARQITLGTQAGNEELDDVITSPDGLDANEPWVLIGGPPCQAYSMAGRSRNKGKRDYRPEEDHRHFLYKEYLRILKKHKPAVFVMENVKGILSSTVGGKRVFHEILRDLSDPNIALEDEASGDRCGRYVICSLTTDEFYHPNDEASSFDARSFVIKAEEYGIPQARHRVILLGIEESLFEKCTQLKIKRTLGKDDVSTVTVREVIEDLPKLRSTLSRGGDTDGAWFSSISEHINALLQEAEIRNDSELKAAFRATLDRLDFGLKPGANRYKHVSSCPKALADWYKEDTSALEVVLNHESRGHMNSDLRRYVYASCYAEAKYVSPKGHKDFDYPGLAPTHANWASGKFADRFRVQVYDRPSTTVVSHISKDGHYFIHPDPSQCRSLTVREAARLQTFPDNYFFQGNRTQQFHQVGNAVPPLLAKKIAEIVKKIIEAA